MYGFFLSSRLGGLRRLLLGLGCKSEHLIGFALQDLILFLQGLEEVTHVVHSILSFVWVLLDVLLVVNSMRLGHQQVLF